MMDGFGVRDLLLIAIALGASVFALRDPVFGILTFVGFGILNPHSMAWSIAGTFRPAQVIAIGTIVGFIFWREPKRLPRQPEVILFLALWGMFGVSTAGATYPDLAFDSLTYVSKILLMVVLSMSLINTRDRLFSMLRVVALSLGFFGFKGGVFAITTGGQYMVWGPEGSFLESNNSIGLALACNVPLLYYLVKVESRRWLRWLMRAMLVLSYPAIVCTFSRGAWLGLAVATTFIVWQSKYRVVVTGALVILLLLMLPKLPHYLPDRVVHRYGDLVNYENEGSAQSRFGTWEFCKRVGLANPVAGAGFRFPSIETYTQYYPEFLAWRGSDQACHSMWFTILGEHGIPGFLLWFTLLASCFLSLCRVRTLAKSRDELQWALHCANMLQAAFAAFMVSGTFLDVAYFDLFYSLVAMAIVTKDLVMRAIPVPRYATQLAPSPAPWSLKP